MGQIPIQDVERAALLARLAMTPAEVERAAKYFVDILDYFQKLKEVDTENVRPYSHEPVMLGALRKDEARSFNEMHMLLDESRFDSDGHMVSKEIFKRGDGA